MTTTSDATARDSDITIVHGPAAFPADITTVETPAETPVDASDITTVETPIEAEPSAVETPAGSDITTVEAPIAASEKAEGAEKPDATSSADAEAEIAAARVAAPAAVAAAGQLAMLEAHNISAWFGDHKVLDHVSLTMEAGQVTALIGPSGCGKSTFLRILNRMHELVPTASLAGEVLIDGQDIYDASKKLTDARRAIGMVFQKPNPFPAMSIYDNVIAGLKLTGIRASRDEKDMLVESSLIRAGLWKEVKDRLRNPGGGLSGGQQQRLCIARSLAVQPRVLLMDEPCSALDPTSTRVIEETMIELQKEVTIVIVTHNMQQAQRVSQNCAFFLASQGTPGVIVEHGETEAMFSEPQDERTFDYVNGRFG
ncbi:phosphate ABC transporter ATP-binding protein [Compostimonas suwonensis]|uniref:Phosphate ABC transporter ATP-binding protein n=2 Tax=Compostimonas suwonensis TaxID=1048394 RepID=A0A2M9C054_9MICO|nr:phosphate ABC transporter ATP-binding protein [Compostimonas suwonensis]